MAGLGLVDSKLGLCIGIDVNKGRNGFEVHVSKDVAKVATYGPE